MTKRLTAAALALAAIFAANPARADYLVYTNRANFEAAITGVKTDNFNELGTTIQTFGATGLGTAEGLKQPLTITGSDNFLLSASGSSLAGYYMSHGTYLLGPLSQTATDGITVTLPADKYTAAGAAVANFMSNSVVSLFVTTSDGASFSTSVLVDATAAKSTFGFLGVVDTTPGDSITSLRFSAPIGANQNVLIDNFTTGFAPLAVPEPASIALFAVGALAAVATAVRRRFRGTPA